MSILRNLNVALSNLRNPREFKKCLCPISLSVMISCRMLLRPKIPHVALPILGVQCHNKNRHLVAFYLTPEPPWGLLVLAELFEEHASDPTGMFYMLLKYITPSLY